MTMQYEQKVTEFILERRNKRDSEHEDDIVVDPDAYVYLPKFQTAGYIVAFVSVFIIVVEVAIILLLAFM